MNRRHLLAAGGLVLADALTTSALPPPLKLPPELKEQPTFVQLLSPVRSPLTYAEATQQVRDTKKPVVVFFWDGAGDRPCIPGGTAWAQYGFKSEAGKAFDAYWGLTGVKGDAIGDMYWDGQKVRGRLRRTKNDLPARIQVPYVTIAERGGFTVWSHLQDYRHRFPASLVNGLTRADAQYVHNLDHARRRREALAFLNAKRKPLKVIRPIRVGVEDCPT